MDREEDSGYIIHVGFLMSELECPTVARDLLLGLRVAGRAGWHRGVPVMVGEVAVPLKGLYDHGRLAR